MTDKRSVPETLPVDPLDSLVPANMFSGDSMDWLRKQIESQPGAPLASWAVEGWDSHLESSKLPEGPNGFLMRDMVAKGGFGEIWEAVQASLGRVVAVKRIRDDLFEKSRGDEEQARYLELTFRQEALTAAQLEHPNIVPIHDLGLDERGAPLLAMKLVRGEPWHRIIADDFGVLPIHDFLAKHLPIFMDVCQAVAFAHSKGVVHRDLKPSQVMVGEFGEVYLMDWGLSLVYDSESLKRSESLDAIDLCIPTPESASNPAGTAAFMAPEQTTESAVGIGPWTDVYLLGGTLYFLLCGSPPHYAENAKISFLRAAGGVVTPPEEECPGRFIPIALRELAMQSMAADPVQRTPSAAAFLAGLKDYLSGSSKRRESLALTARVEAQLDSERVGYEDYARSLTLLTQAEATWGQNPSVATLRERSLVGLAHLALENGDLTLARLQAVRIEHEHTKAELLSRISRAAADHAAQRRQKRIAVGAAGALLLAVVLVALYAVSQRGERRIAEERASRQRDLAFVLSTVNDLRRDELALAEKAGRLLPLPVELKSEFEPPAIETDEAAVGALLDERRRLHSIRGDLVAQGVSNLDPEPLELQLADANHLFHSAGKASDYREALALYSIAQTQRPDRPEPYLGMALSAFKGDLATSAVLFANRAVELTGALRGLKSDEYARALSLAGQVWGELDSGPDSAADYFERSLEVLLPRWVDYSLMVASQYEHMGRFAESLAYSSPTLAVAARIYPPDSVDLAYIHNDVSTELINAGELDAAMQLLKKAGATWDVVGKEHVVARTATMLNIAHILGDRADYNGSVDLIRAAIAIMESDEEVAGGKLHGLALNNLALVLMRMGRNDEALDPLREAIRIFEAYHGPRHENVALALDNLAGCLIYLRRMDEAEPLMKRSLEMKRSLFGPDHPRIGISIANLGAFKQRKGDYAGAEVDIREAARILEKSYGPYNHRVAVLLNNLAHLREAPLDFEESLRLNTRALEIYRKNYGESHPDYAMTLRRLGNTLIAMGRHEEALAHLEPAAGVYREMISAQPNVESLRTDLAVVESDVASALEGLGRLDDAVAAVERALAGWRSQPEGTEPSRALRHDTAQRLIMLALVQRKLGQHEAAADNFAEAESILLAIHNDADLEVIARLAVIYAETGRFEEARLLLPRVSIAKATNRFLRERLTHARELVMAEQAP